MMARLAGKDERNATVGKTLTHKLIESHLAAGRIEPGSEIGIRIDQTLTQDATGTMAYLQFEAMGIGRVRTELSMSYIDHNTIQIGFENADDHRYLHSVARRYGIRLSRAGNGICHQVHLERFGRPGKTLLGSDSHTSTCGALGMLAIEQGRSVRFRQTAELVLQLGKANRDGALDSLLRDLARADLIILDEFGYVPFDIDGARLLYQIIAGSYERRSIIFTTNIEFSKWGTIFADDKLAAAIIDRIVHHGRLIEFTGPSRRVSQALMFGKTDNQ